MDASSSAGPRREDGAAVVVDGVVKAFGDQRALRGIDAQIRPGRLTGLVGPDGAGKTTLMRIMAGLMAPTEGRVTLCGLDVAREGEAVHAITGYMPQRFGLYEDLTVLQNMSLYAELRGMNRRQHSDTFERLLDFTRLQAFTGRLAGKLSGGMKQKLGLACALMATPRVLLLDEPGVGVDPVSRQDLWRMVKALTDDGMAVVWSTAYLDEAERCEHVLLLNEGKLEFDGPPAALTGRLHDRSFRIDEVGDERRAVLARALDLESVCDGVIQGAAVRVVLRENADREPLEQLAAEVGGSLDALPPRFEDAFVDLLGGGPGGTSELAERMQAVELDSEIAVSCRHLTKRFGDFAATDDVSFEVRRGEIFGLLGPNGAGKSTTFEMLCGLLTPSDGEAHVAGHNLRSATSQAKRQLGYMAQKFSLYGLLSVGQNLEFSAGVYGLEGRIKRERIDEMIEIFQLGPYLKASPDSLPLGFKQRLAMACALMHRPPVLFLDEPTSGVDPITRREFWTHINGLVRRGVTVMVTTHFMDEAEYCDRVALMYQSRLIALDTPDALKQKAVTAERPEPTMEDAFIHLVEAEDGDNEETATDADPAADQMREHAESKDVPATAKRDARAQEIAHRRFDLRRLAALVRKESLQLVRDPSSILIAFALPVMLLFLFAYAVSLDIRQVRLGVVLESDGAAAHSLAAAFSGTRYFEVTPAHDRREVAGQLISGKLAGYVVIPQDFETRAARHGSEPLVQIITDGSQPNTASFVANYANGVLGNWLASHAAALPPAPRITLKPRFWFNPEIDTRRALLPGAVAIVMTIIGTLLTALVVAREWERGTMEAIMSTPASVPEILIGKLLPYFLLGLAATIGTALLVILAFGVPIRGSWLALLAMSSAFLVPALGQGLLISSMARNQFIAAQLALLSGFLPAFLLSGFIYEIDSMPLPIRGLTHLVAARYFIDSLRTVFLAGDVWPMFLANMAAMLAIGSVFFFFAMRKTRKTLDT